MTPDQKARDIMDEACLPKWYYDNGVYSACVSAIERAIAEAEAPLLKRIDELKEKWHSSRDACASACRRANELRSEREGLKAAINADEIVLILSENEGASHGYLAIQICEKIEADAHQKHQSSEYMRNRPKGEQ